MAEKETVGVRLPTDTVEEIESMAKEKDISKSDATRRLIREGMKLQGSGLTVAAGNYLSSSDSDYSEAHSPLNHNPYSVLTFALTVLITLRVFGIL